MEEKIAGTDQFIVSLKVHPTNRIQVFVDALGGLNVNDCVSISRQIESNLDRDVEDYELQVSSPGLTEPFQHPLQFKKNVGREIKVTTTDGSTHKGQLVSFTGEEITLQPAKKKKKQEAPPLTLVLSEIKEAKTVISFK